MSRPRRLAALFVLLATPAPAAPETLVCAASSLVAPLNEITAAFAAAAPELGVRLHLAGSTALRRQVEAGGPCDVLIAASAADVDSLAARGLVVSTLDVARNRLVVFTRDDGPTLATLAALRRAELGRIAVGDPATAPVGLYAAQALTAAGLHRELAPRLLPCSDAMHVAAAVRSGAAGCGLAYRTDVTGAVGLRESCEVPDSLYAAVLYRAALLRRAERSTAAARFVLFCGDVQARRTLRRHGFVTEGEDPAPPGALVADGRRGATLQPLWLSLRVAALATILAAGIGLALAAHLAQGRPGWRRDLLSAGADLPMVLPPTVVGVVLLELCGPRGPLGKLAGSVGLSIPFTWGAAVLASTVMALPLMVRPARSALESVPSRYMQAARNLGATPWEAFWRVQLPLARRGVVAGALLAFFRALGEFGATLMLAGNIPGHTQTLPLAIYDAVFAGRNREALVWVLGVMAFTLVGAVAAQRLGARTPQ